jgi:hypothetical protein
VIHDGAIDIPLDGRRLDASAIVAVPELAARLRAMWSDLAGAIEASRVRREGLGPAA